MLDFYFFYKNIGRHILILKKSEFIYHNSNIIDLSQLVVYFNIISFKDLNSIELLNYMYFFKFYFRVVPFISNYSHKFHLNIDYYNFLVQHSFVGKNLYFPLYFFTNDIYHMINKSYKHFNSSINYVEYRITDMNFFIEKKNSVGFFSLKAPINFRLNIKNHSFIDHNNLLIIFKLKN